MKEYKDCLQLLNYSSKEELLTKLEKVVKILETDNKSNLKDFEINLKKHIKIIKDASLEVSNTVSETVSVNDKLSRQQLKEVS